MIKTFFQRKCTYGQQIYEKVFNIANHQLSSNEKNTSHRQNGYHQKYNIENTCYQVHGEKRTLVYCWWDWVDADTMNNTMEVPQKIKSRTTIWSNNFILGVFPEENKNTNLKRCMHVNVLISILYNSQAMNTT